MDIDLFKFIAGKKLSEDVCQNYMSQIGTIYLIPNIVNLKFKISH